LFAAESDAVAAVAALGGRIPTATRSTVEGLLTPWLLNVLLSALPTDCSSPPTAAAEVEEEEEEEDGVRLVPATLLSAAEL
jgi:hypothetical protein